MILFVTGKNQLKTTVLSAMESGSYALEKIGLQAVLTGSALSPCDIATMIDSVSAGEVKAVCILVFVYIHIVHCFRLLSTFICSK